MTFAPASASAPAHAFARDHRQQNRTDDLLARPRGVLRTKGRIKRIHGTINRRSGEWHMHTNGLMMPNMQTSENMRTGVMKVMQNFQMDLWKLSVLVCTCHQANWSGIGFSYVMPAKPGERQ